MKVSCTILALMTNVLSKGQSSTPVSAVFYKKPLLQGLFFVHGIRI